MGDKITFRFMSGDHIGSALQLGQGSYTLGGTSSCDICLNDADLVNKSINISIDESLNVFVEAINGQAHIDGEILEGCCELRSGALLSIGLVSLMYVDAGEDFLPVAMAKIIGVKDNDESLTEKGADADEISANSSTEEDTNTQKDDNNIKEDVKDIIKQDTKEEGVFKLFKLKKPNYLWINGIGALLLLCILFVLIAGGNIWTQKSAFEQDRQVLENYAIKKDLANFKIYEDKNLIVIEGILKDDSAYKDFLVSLPVTSCATMLNLSIESDLPKAIEKAFLLHGFYVKAKKLDPSSYVIYGYSKDAYVIYKALVDVKNQFENINFKLSLTYMDDLKLLLKKHDTNLVEKLNISPKLNYVVYDDRFSIKEEIEFKNLVNAIEQDVGSKINFVSFKDTKKTDIDSFDTISTKDTLNRVKANSHIALSPYSFSVDDVLGVTLKPMKFITLKNGVKYFEGALMPGGYTLKDIAIDKLVLDKDGVNIEYALK